MGGDTAPPTAFREPPREPLSGPPPGQGPSRQGPSGQRDAAERRLRGLGPWLGLVALCLALYLPGLGALPPFDRDEARFAQASKQMLETGDYVHINFQDDPRNKKPIGIHWAQVSTARLFGGAEAPIWAYRLPSVLAATLAVLLLYGATRRLADASTAFLAASLLAACLLTVVEAHLAKTDAAVLASTTAAQSALALIYFRARADLPAGRWLPLGFWTAVGIGILVKGPITPLIAALTVASLAIADRSATWLRGMRPLVGMLIVAAIVAPWTIAVSGGGGGGRGFVVEAVTEDLLPKLIGGQESHGAPPGLYLALLLATFFPASLFAVPAVVRGWQQRRLPAERFLLAWLLPAWLLFELIPTKLPHYVLPLYPALAILAARLIMTAPDAEDAVWRRWWVRAPAVLWALIAVALGAAAVALPLLVDRRFDALAIVPALGFAATGAGSLMLLWRGEAARAAAVMVVGAAVGFSTLLQTVLPRLDAVWLSRSATAMLQPHRGPDTAIAAAGYTEPSLVFLAGTGIRLGGGAGAAELLAGRPGALALVANDQEAAFRTALAERGAAARELDHRRGYNYSKGRWVTLTLYARVPPR